MSATTQSIIGMRTTQKFNGGAYGVRMLGAAFVVNRVPRHFWDNCAITQSMAPVEGHHSGVSAKSPVQGIDYQSGSKHPHSKAVALHLVVAFIFQKPLFVT